ncbi:MAG: hypothetical protein H6727_15230 [Myxococcales bacterium]|nr:hypothetical protein [Myxococcales bacterium]
MAKKSKSSKNKKGPSGKAKSPSQVTASSKAVDVSASPASANAAETTKSSETAKIEKADVAKATETTPTHETNASVEATAPTKPAEATEAAKVSETADAAKVSETTDAADAVKTAETAEVSETAEATPTESDFFSSPPKDQEEDEYIDNARADEMYWEMESDPVIPIRWRPYLPLLVFFVTLWLMFQLSHELRYYWAKGPVSLGDITDGCGKDFYKKAQSNGFVRIKQILPDVESTTEARVSISKYNYTFAMGCDLLIAVPAERYQKLFGGPPPQASARKKPKRREVMIATPQGMVEKQGDIKTFAVQGRILRLVDVTSLQPVREFYRRSEHSLPARTLVLFDGEEPSGKWWVLLLYGVFVMLCGMSLQRFLFFTRMAEDDQAALEAMELEDRQ